MKIEVKATGLSELRLRLAGLDRKIKVITKSALNDAAYLASKKTVEAMIRVFDMPTPWILGSVRYKKATPEKLESQVDFDQWGNKQIVTAGMVLNAEIFGGRRKLKRHEVALQRAGILPPGMAIVPGAGAKLDQYGTMDSGQIKQIMAWFMAHGEQGYKSNMTDRTRDARRRGSKKTNGIGFEFFVVKAGDRRTFTRASGKTGTHKLQPGIYQRFFLGHGTAIRPIMIFVSIPNYKQRLDFYGIARKAAEEEFQRSFDKYAKQLLTERGL